MRRCHIENTPAFIVARGDEERGGVVIKLNHFSKGCEVLQPITDMNGERVWMRITGEVAVVETVADELIAKRRKYDNDLWVIEIEDPEGSLNMEAFLDEKVE